MKNQDIMVLCNVAQKLMLTLNVHKKDVSFSTTFFIKILLKYMDIPHKKLTSCEPNGNFVC